MNILSSESESQSCGGGAGRGGAGGGGGGAAAAGGGDGATAGGGGGGGGEPAPDGGPTGDAWADVEASVEDPLVPPPRRFHSHQAALKQHQPVNVDKIATTTSSQF